MSKQKVVLACIVMVCAVSGRKLMHDHMKDALDDISFFHRGNGHPFNASFYHELVQCFHKFDDTTLYASQIGGWKGIADYWLSNATNVDYMGQPDPWGQTSPGLKGDKKPYDEYYYRPNVTLGRYGILTYEPCNYESNIAYYHSVLKICKYDNWAISKETQHNLLQAMATMAIGSSFMHQSYTYVGVRYDNMMIAVIAYLGYQSLIQNLPNQTPMLVELQQQWRPMNATQLMSNITETIRTQPVPTWAEVLDKGDYPHDYMQTFAAIVCDITALVFPAFITSPVIYSIVSIILPKRKEWITAEYLPTLFESTKNNQIPLYKRLILLIKFYGVLFKLLYAFLFQEHFIPIPGFRSWPIIWMGGSMIPVVNYIADTMTGFHQLDENVNKSQYLYPGQDTCKYEQGHSIWHEMSANGLLDLIYLCDYMNQLIIEHIK